MVQALTQALKLPMEQKQALRVMIAGGRQLQCLGMCKNLIICLGEHTFYIDFFVIPLGGFDAILGVNWLKTLGPIQWDFA